MWIESEKPAIDNRRYKRVPFFGIRIIGGKVAEGHTPGIRGKSYQNAVLNLAAIAPERQHVADIYAGMGGRLQTRKKRNFPFSTFARSLFLFGVGTAQDKLASMLSLNRRSSAMNSRGTLQNPGSHSFTT